METERNKVMERPVLETGSEFICQDHLCLVRGVGVNYGKMCSSVSMTIETLSRLPNDEGRVKLSDRQRIEQAQKQIAEIIDGLKDCDLKVYAVAVTIEEPGARVKILMEA